MTLTLHIDERRALHDVNPLIYGQFIEHFGRQVYGGIYDPGHPLSDADGMRRDVIAALRRLRIPVMRWPGGCFVSAYHWKDGVGRDRTPTYDKAWCVEESHAFGTDEFMTLCRKIGAEPYLCTNAGTGTPEEMSDWVEYCNEPSLGRWAKRRIANGHEEPYRVRYWSIGNENYTGGEIGAKTAQAWGPFVRESAKMMRRVDPGIKILAAAVPDIDWNLALLRSAGDLIDAISIHGYFDEAWETNALSGYRKSLQAPAQFEQSISAVRGLLCALGLDRRVKIAFDEWNLRGWYHPGIADFSRLDPDHGHAAALRAANEVNAQYTMADAIFAASFLHLCMRNGDIVSMANFSPTVCGRGLIGVSDTGIVLRPAYFVFDLLRNQMGAHLVDSYAQDMAMCDADGVPVPVLDAVAARCDDGALTVSLINRDPEQTVSVRLDPAMPYARAQRFSLVSPEADSANDFDCPNRVHVEETAQPLGAPVQLAPHSVTVLLLFP